MAEDPGVPCDGRHTEQQKPTFFVGKFSQKEVRGTLSEKKQWKSSNAARIVAG
jgi:hypothetical protein